MVCCNIFVQLKRRWNKAGIMILSYCSANQTSHCCTFNGGGCDLCEVDKQKLVIQNSHTLLCNLVPSPCNVCWYPVCVSVKCTGTQSVIHTFPVCVIHLFLVCVIHWFTVSVIHLFPVFAILWFPICVIHWFIVYVIHWLPVYNIIYIYNSLSVIHWLLVCVIHWFPVWFPICVIHWF